MRGKMPARVLVRAAARKTLALLTTGTLTDHRLGASVAVVADYEGAVAQFTSCSARHSDGSGRRTLRADMIPSTSKALAT